MVRLVTAVIKPHMLDAVREELQPRSIHGMTVAEVRGFGRQRGHTETYRGTEYAIDLIPKLRLEILCAAELVDDVMEAIRKAAYTGKIGDGKIWVLDVEQVMRVRTGEMGTDAT